MQGQLPLLASAPTTPAPTTPAPIVEGRRLVAFEINQICWFQENQSKIEIWLKIMEK